MLPEAVPGVDLAEHAPTQARHNMLHLPVRCVLVGRSRPRQACRRVAPKPREEEEGEEEGEEEEEE